jgi:hypothetical protein
MSTIPIVSLAPFGQAFAGGTAGLAVTVEVSSLAGSTLTQLVAPTATGFVESSADASGDYLYVYQGSPGVIYVFNWTAVTTATALQTRTDTNRGPDPWATDIVAGDYAANTAGALLLNRPYLAQSGTTGSFVMSAGDPLFAQGNVGLQVLFPGRTGSNQAGAGFTALITASDPSTGTQTFSPPCPTAVDSSFYYATFVPILNARLAGDGLDGIQVESGINARQALSPILAAAAGVITGNGTGTVLVKAPRTSTTRIAATMGPVDRIATTLTLPA